MSVTRYETTSNLGTPMRVGLNVRTIEAHIDFVLAAEYNALEAAYLKMKQELDDAQSVTSDEGARVWQDKYRVAQSRIDGVEAELAAVEQERDALRGTPAARFAYLTTELEKRFPHPKPLDSTKVYEHYALEAIDALKVKLAEAQQEAHEMAQVFSECYRRLCFYQPADRGGYSIAEERAEKVLAKYVEKI